MNTHALQATYKCTLIHYITYIIQKAFHTESIYVPVSRPVCSLILYIVIVWLSEVIGSVPAQTYRLILHMR